MSLDDFARYPLLFGPSPVHRLDRLTADNVADLRQVLDGMENAPLGIVVIGARAEISPYYLQRRPTVVQTGPETG